MKIVYMGTPEIAKVCLEKLYTEGFDIAAVYTKPDTPKNRGMKLIASEVKTYAVWYKASCENLLGKRSGTMQW